MEGPNLRSCPRTLLSCPIELRVGKETIRVKQAMGNLSAGGLFIEAGELPVDAAVHVKIAGAPPFEADGVVRFCDAKGVGIEFTTITENNRRHLDKLIAEFAESETRTS